MRKALVYLTIGCVLSSLLAGVALGQPATDKTQARLVLSAQSAQPGQNVWAAVHLKLKPGWHTYWRNPGDSGAAPTIEWKLPTGVTAGEILWPAPEKATESDLNTYVYREEVALVVPLTLAANLSPGPQDLSAKVDWLECDQQCVPAKATVKAVLTIGGVSQPSPEAALVESWRAKIPAPNPALAATARWEKDAAGDNRPLVVEWTPKTPASSPDLFPYENSKFDVQAATEVVPGDADKLRLRKVVKKSEGDWPKEVSGLLIEKSAAGPVTATEVKLMLAGQPAASPGPGGPAVPAEAPAATAVQRSLLGWLVLAFVGGLILNIMPCVLPVLALKILGFVNQSRDEPGRVRKLGLVSAVGVLASFMVLASLVLAVQAAGRQASWGMQFGNPIFVVILTALVTLVALNLFGLFEVYLGGSVMGAADHLAAREGSAGAFFNGVLAVALATPCTAPFLAPALGFAFLQPPAVILLMFATVGAGLAAPYVVLSCAPQWLKFLPKPGAWMEKFKQAMGFPMLATAVWLFSIAQRHYGKHVLWLGLFLVELALAAWVWGEFVQRSRRRRGLAAIIALSLLCGGYLFALEGQLHWRSPAVEAADNGSLQESPEGIAWQKWTPAAVHQARAQGRPVLVDFTADWCVTCQANKKTSIEITSVRAKLKEMNAVPLLGDYTKIPDDITAELRRFGRAGVPLVLVYPKDTNAAPLVLPEVLTPNRVLEALEKASR